MPEISGISIGMRIVRVRSYPPDFINKSQSEQGPDFGWMSISFCCVFDLGLKLHDPMQAEGQRFVLLNRNGGFNKSVFNIAIGYPF